MAKAYMFSFDLHNKSGDVYSNIEEDIKKQFPESVKILYTTYVFTTTLSLVTVSGQLKAILDRHVGEQNHEYYAVRMAEPGHGWLKKAKIDLLNRILAKVLVYC